MKFSPDLVVVWVSTTMDAEILLQENFEAKNPRQFVVNITNSTKDDVIYFAGVSQEQAAGGKKSFKIDMTVADGDFIFWTLPADFPFTHPLKVEGKICLESDMTALLDSILRTPSLRSSSRLEKAVCGTIF